jgi:PilZ domain
MEMKLSPATFRELTRSMAGSAVVSQNERRRSRRVEVKSRVPLSLIKDGQALAAVPIMVKDVSPRGINIVYPEALTPGQQFTVQLLEGTQKITLLCTVLHSRPLASGLHTIGAEFTCVLPTPREKDSDDNRAQERIRHSMLD